MVTFINYKNLFWMLILAFSLTYILLVFNWGEIASILIESNLWVFILGSVLTINLFWAIRALRWYILLKTIGYSSVPIKSLYFATVNSLALSVITPMQSGELLKVELLKKSFGDLSRTDGYVSLMLERILDLLVVSAIAGISLIFSPIVLPDGIINFFVIGGVVFVLLLYFFRKKLIAYSEQYNELKQKFYRLFMKPSIMLSLVLCTFLAWLSIVLGWWLALYSLGMMLNPIDVTSLTTGMTLVNVTSLVPGAIGVSEVGISIWLELLGFDQNKSAAGSIAIRIYGLISVAIGLLGILFVILKKILISQEKQ